MRSQLAKRNPVLRALGTCDGRFHGTEIQVEDGGVVTLPLSRHPEQPLGLEVALHSLHLVFAAAGRAQVEAGLLVDGEVPDRRSVLGRHVRQRRTVRHREASRAFAVELDELADHPRLAQELRDPQHQVSRGHALAQPAVQVHADHVREKEVHGLPEHRRLSLDAADSPADDPKAVDHRGVRIGAHQGVGIEDAVFLQDSAPEEFEVDLVADAESRRHDPQSVERLRPPLEELVALAIAAELHVHVELQCVRLAVMVDLHGVIDHQVDRHHRLNPLDVRATPGHRRAHRSEVDEQRHPGEILQENPPDHEGHFRRPHGAGLPARQHLHVLVANAAVVQIAQYRFEHNADADRQSRNCPNVLFF